MIPGHCQDPRKDGVGEAEQVSSHVRATGGGLRPDHVGIINLGFLKYNEKPLKGLKQGSDICLNDISLIATY